MIELRKLIQAYLLSLHPRVFYTPTNSAPVDADPPYLTYSFQPSNTPDESKESMIMDLEGWDIPAGGDTTVIEELMELIKGDGNIAGDPTGLDGSTLSNTKISARFNFESRLMAPDEDPSVKHIVHNYQITLFERSI